MSNNDVIDRADIEDIVARFYQSVLKDPIIGFIFTDIAKIDLPEHLPIIVDFWADSLFGSKEYSGNTLRKHTDIHQKMPLRPGHFTRWLFLFNKAVDDQHSGPNADQMKRRAEMVAKSISAAITENKRANMNLVLNKSDGT